MWVTDLISSMLNTEIGGCNFSIGGCNFSILMARTNASSNILLKLSNTANV